MITSRISLVLSLCLLFMAGGCVSMGDMAADPTSSRHAGMQFYRQGQYSDAAGAFRNAIRKDPRDYKSHYYLAMSYEWLKQYQQAIQEYGTTLDVMTRTLAGQEDIKTRMEVLDTLASCIARCDDRDVQIDRVAKRANEDQKAEEWFLLGKIYRNEGDPDSAIDAYNRARLIEPKNVHIARDYGLYLERIGQNERAIRPLQEAYSLNPEDTQVADALRRLGQVPGQYSRQVSDPSKPLTPPAPPPADDFGELTPPGPAAHAPAASVQPVK